MKCLSMIAAVACVVLSPAGHAQRSDQPPWLNDTASVLERDWTAAHGDGQRARLHRGLAQIASLWREGDGAARGFGDFVHAPFAAAADTLDAMVERSERRFD